MLSHQRSENFQAASPAQIAEMQNQHSNALQEINQKNQLLEDQLSIAEQLFQNVVRVFDEYELAEEELLNHIGIFLENNVSLLRQQRGEDAGLTEEETDSKLDASNMHGAPRYQHSNRASLNNPAN